MHASCTICGDIFTGIDPEVIRTTQCGHIFHHQCLMEWLNRANTCPQCRSKVDKRNIIKLYFQLSTYPTQDSGTLENTVQNLKFQLKLKDMDVSKLTEENEKAKTQLTGLKTLLKEAEDKIRNHTTVLQSLQDKVKILKTQAKAFSEEKHKNEELRRQLEQYENLEKILKGSASDAADTLALMKDVTDPSILCACISTLKREMQNHKEKSKDLQSLLKFKENKLSSALQEISNLEKEISILNRSLTKVKEDLSYTETENESLRKKCKHLEDAIMSPPGDSTNINARDKALRRFINEFPTPVLKESPTIELNIPTTSSVPVASTQRETSPTSPVRFNHFKDSRRFVLNKRRLIGAPSSGTSEQPCYDGFGGHIKEEVTLTDKATLLRAIEKSKTNKIPLNNKRFKPTPKPDTSQNTLFKFCTKKS